MVWNVVRIGIVAVALASPLMAATGSYGEGMSLPASATVDVNDVMKDPEAFADRHIRVQGKVDGVCARRGCWLSLEGPGEDSLFVKFTCPIAGRLIPAEALGHVAVVEGKLEIKMISEDTARHMAEEAGQSAEEVAKIVGEQRQIALASPSALVHDLPATTVE